MDPKFTTDHEWITVAGDLATIGITDFAQAQLGDLVFIELPKVGQKLKSGDITGTVESGKAVSDIFAPVAGEVVEINNAVVEDPSLVNVDAMTAWFFKLRMEAGADLSKLMDEAQYKEYAK
jgi:glycine cleavage system H protein